MFRIPLINPGRAHRFEIDKRLAADTLPDRATPTAPLTNDSGPDGDAPTDTEP